MWLAKTLADFKINNIAKGPSASTLFIDSTMFSLLWLALGSLGRLFRNRRYLNPRELRLTTAVGRAGDKGGIYFPEPRFWTASAQAEQAERRSCLLCFTMRRSTQAWQLCNTWTSQTDQ